MINDSHSAVMRMQQMKAKAKAKKLGVPVDLTEEQPLRRKKLKNLTIKDNDTSL